MNALRNVLAALALLGLTLFVGWHVLLWRMHEVYRRDSAS